MNENTYKLCLRLTSQERAKLEADARRCSPLLGRTAYRGQPRRMKLFGNGREMLSVCPPLAKDFVVCVVPKEE